MGEGLEAGGTVLTTYSKGPNDLKKGNNHFGSLFMFYVDFLAGKTYSISKLSEECTWHMNL